MLYGGFEAGGYKSPSSEEWWYLSSKFGWPCPEFNARPKMMLLTKYRPKYISKIKQTDDGTII